MLYPSYSYRSAHSQSYLDNANAPVLSMKMIQWFSLRYFSSFDEITHPLASPFDYIDKTKKNDLSNLPPAMVITAEYDPLRDEGNIKYYTLVIFFGFSD